MSKDPRRESSATAKPLPELRHAGAPQGLTLVRLNDGLGLRRQHVEDIPWRVAAGILKSVDGVWQPDCCVPAFLVRIFRCLTLAKGATQIGSQILRHDRLYFPVGPDADGPWFG